MGSYSHAFSSFLLFISLFLLNKERKERRAAQKGSNYRHMENKGKYMEKISRYMGVGLLQNQ